MKNRFQVIFLVLLVALSSSTAYSFSRSITVSVPSDGSSSRGIQLYPGHMYTINVYDTFKYKGSNSIASACQAISPQREPVMFAQNNLGILLDCSHTTNNSYGYESKQFSVTRPLKINFYIEDTYYSDNSGYLKAFVYDFGTSANQGSTYATQTPIKNVSGRYFVDIYISGNSTAYHELLVLQQSEGKITGGSLELVNGGSLWTIYKGSVVKNKIEFYAYFGKPNGLHAHFTGIIDGDNFMKGNWADIQPGTRTGTWATKK